MMHCVAFTAGLWHNPGSSNLFPKNLWGFLVSDRSKSSETKSVKASVPSVLKMMETDAELKDFFRLVHEHGYRAKAAELLAERLKKPQLQSK